MLYFSASKKTTMKKTFTKQLALILILLISGLSKAQFMCTDINPDSVITYTAAGTHSFEIDINNDNIKDFQFSTQMVSPTFGFIIVQANSAVPSTIGNYVLVTGSGSLSALNLGAPISSSSSSWHPMTSTNPSIISLMNAPPVGSWAGQNDKYVGVAVAVATNTFFGWIRMSASGTIASYTVKEYGYNSVPGASIAAGQACAPASTFAATFNLQDTICQNTTVLVTKNTGTVAASGYTWSASPIGAVIAAPNASATNITFTSTGVFTVSLAATSGTMTGSSSQTIFVAPKPVVSVFSSSASICSGASAVLTASGSGTFYQWSTSATGPTISVSPTVNTTYTVTAWLGACSSTAAITQSVHICSGLNDYNEMEFGYDLFPNPTNSKLNIRSANSGQSKISVVVSDLLGKTHLMQNVIFADQFATHTLDLTQLSTGVYFVTLKGDSGNSKVTRIIKE